MALRMISCCFNVSDALLQEETARELLAGIAEQHARTTIALQHPLRNRPVSTVLWGRMAS